MVRVNALDTGLTDADLDAVVPAGRTASCCPRRKAASAVTHLDAKLTAREAIAGLPDGAIKIVALATETAASLFLPAPIAARARALPASPGARKTSRPSSAPRPTATSTAASSTLTVWRAASARRRPPPLRVPAIDTVYVGLPQHAGLRQEAEEARRDGFTAKMAIHPGASRGHQRSVHPDR